MGYIINMETGKLDGTWQVDKVMILKQERTVKCQVSSVKCQVKLQLFTRIFKKSRNYIYVLVIKTKK